MDDLFKFVILNFIIFELSSVKTIGEMCEIRKTIIMVVNQDLVNNFILSLHMGI